MGGWGGCGSGVVPTARIPTARIPTARIPTARIPTARPFGPGMRGAGRPAGEGRAPAPTAVSSCEAPGTG
jgi:hypothetical protein